MENGITSFAQNGEDIIIESILFRNFGRKHPFTYMDIGCNDPISKNNSYHSYLRGGRGILVEPNPSLADKIMQKSPEDIFYNVGVSPMESGELFYYDFGENDGLNTFSHDAGEATEKIWKGVKLIRKIKLPVIPINELLEKHFLNKELDFLSIDCEGMDAEIIKAIDLNITRPKVICFECNAGDPGECLFIDSFLIENGYFCAASTRVNAMYIDALRLSRTDVLSWIPVSADARLKSGVLKGSRLLRSIYIDPSEIRRHAHLPCLEMPLPPRVQGKISYLIRISSFAPQDIILDTGVRESATVTMRPEWRKFEFELYGEKALRLYPGSGWPKAMDKTLGLTIDNIEIQYGA